MALALPEEARRWLRWHDGSAGWDLIGGRIQFSLEEAVGGTLDFRDMDSRWQPGWINVMNEKPFVLFDCAGTDLQPVPVWHYDYEQNYPTRPLFLSIGDMISFWIDLIDRGLMYWQAGPDAGAGAWRFEVPLPDDVGKLLGGCKPNSRKASRTGP